MDHHESRVTPMHHYCT